MVLAEVQLKDLIENVKFLVIKDVGDEKTDSLHGCAGLIDSFGWDTRTDG
jgi:hypothetical protein